MRRILKGQRGFTLIEILVAVGILAILAGVAVPVVVSFTSSSQEKSAAAEKTNVQVAIDAMMTDKELGSLPTTSPVTGTVDALVDTVGEATSTMTVFPYSDGDYALRPTYLRSDTKGTYYVDPDGTVHQNTTGY